MEIQSYKCPNCGGGLVFDPKTQKFKCEYCLSAFTEETLKEMEEVARKSEEASKPGGMPEAEKIESQKQAESKMVLYTCLSCGAEIVAQETTASTYCCYCHNPVVLSGSLDGKYRPDGLIPFEIDKKKAKEIFKNWIQKKSMCRMISTRRVRWSIWREFIIHIGCIAARYPVRCRRRRCGNA